MNKNIYTILIAILVVAITIVGLIGVFNYTHIALNLMVVFFGLLLGGIWYVLSKTY